MRYNKNYRKSRKSRNLRKSRSRSNYSKKVSKRRYSRKRGSGVFGCDKEIIYKGSYSQYVDVGCRQKTQKVIVNRSVRNIGPGAFAGFKSLTSITLPKTVRNIDDGAFRGCTSLASITIPKGVTTIGSHAFKGCTSLAKVTFPNSLRKIYRGAFLDCPNLKIKNFHDKIEIEEEYERGDDNCYKYGIEGIFDENTQVEVESPDGKKEYKSIKDIEIKLFSDSPCRR